jgi:hypothetical protein
MIYAVYQTENGQLVSVASDITLVASQDILTARGYSVKELPDGTQNGIWNINTLEFDPPPPPSTEISTHDFILRFTPDEFAAIQKTAQTVPQVSQWLLALSTTQILDLTNPVVVGAVNQLAALNLIAPERVSVLLGA